MNRSNRGCRTNQPRTSGKPAREEDATARHQHAGAHAGNQDGLDDETLLRICGVSPDDAQVTPACKADLRASSSLIGRYSPRRHRYLSAALSLLAAVLAQLSSYAHGHTSFHSAPPVVQAYGWVDRNTLERTATQVASLQWPDVPPGLVAMIVQDGVTSAEQLGYLSSHHCDGSRLVSAKALGVRSAREVAAIGESSQASPTRTPINPRVQLGPQGEHCQVLGKVKAPLTNAQHAVVSALIQAGGKGMTKDGLEAVRPSARRILKALRKDNDWANVISMPGQTNGRYHIRV